MGDNILESQVKNARKRRDRAMMDMQSPSLLNRPEVVRRLFTVKPVKGVTFQVGEELRVVRTNGDLSLDVTRDYRRTGIINGEGALVLGQVLGETNGIATVVIREVLGLSGFGKAEIIQDIL